MEDADTLVIVRAAYVSVAALCLLLDAEPE